MKNKPGPTTDRRPRGRRRAFDRDRALARYRETDGAFTGRALREEGNAADALDRIIRESVRRFCEPGRPGGCMISTAELACAAENEPVAEHVAGLRRETLTALEQRISRGIEAGDLRPDTVPAALARYVGAIIQGMSVQARDGAGEAEIAAIADIARAEIARRRAPPPDGGGRGA